MKTHVSAVLAIIFFIIGLNQRRCNHKNGRDIRKYGIKYAIYHIY